MHRKGLRDVRAHAVAEQCKWLAGELLQQMIVDDVRIVNEQRPALVVTKMAE